MPPRWLDISVDKLTSNRILLQGGGRKGAGEEREHGENWEYPGHGEAKKGDRKQVRSRLERGTTISCFSSEIRRAAIAPPSAWQTRAILMNMSYLFFCHRSHKPGPSATLPFFHLPFIFYRCGLRIGTRSISSMPVVLWESRYGSTTKLEDLNHQSLDLFSETSISSDPSQSTPI